jgi:hypothetical protein
MNASPMHRRAIAAILASALTLAGCTSKSSTVPAGQTPAATTNTNPAGTNTASAAPPAQVAQAPAPAPAPAPPPQPAPLVLPRGTRLEVRLNRTIDVKHTESGDHFTGSLAQAVVVGNTIAVPQGSGATGEVLLAHKRGRFKGQSTLALTLTRLDVNGTAYRIDTGTLARSKKGKGKRTAAFIGGGAGMGMLIGGIATGGVGLLVGGLAGGGAGALGAAFTGNRDLSIPAETVVTFRLQDALTLAPETQVSALDQRQ